MGTQPLDKESNLRKPSKIGEEIRKELEKRGLRAPKAERAKPNGKKNDSAVEVPIQISVQEDVQEELDVEIKSIEHMHAEDSDESDEVVVSEVESVTDEIDENEGYREAALREDEPVLGEEEKTDGELDRLAEDPGDTKPLSIERSASADQDGISEERSASKSILMPSSQAEGPEPDLRSTALPSGPNMTIQPMDGVLETEVDLGSLSSGDEYGLDLEKPSGGQSRVEDQELKIEMDKAESVQIDHDLPETAELDKGTVDVLDSYQNLNTSIQEDQKGGDTSFVVESLLSDASHELRTPLQAISGFLELLVNQETSDTRLEEEFLSIAYRECTHLADIVADLETASLIDSGNLKLQCTTISVERLIEDSIQRFNQPEWEGQILLADSRLKDLPELFGDEIYLRQAVNNLIGAVLRPLRADHHVFIRTIVDEGDVILQVASGGENPAEDTLTDIRAAQREGRDHNQEGLAIFVTRHIVEAHGGMFMAEGNEREGLCYTMQIPSKPKRKHRGTVLITEDNTHAALLMEYALERDGYTPIKATNGLEALEIVANDSVDLVILDVVLPGMDGFEICYRMRSSPKTAAIPVVIVSAKTGDEYRSKALRVGADAYFNKPLVLADLLLTMDKLLENGETDSTDGDVGGANP